MKKITLILTVFILVLSIQSYAQETSPLTKSVDQVEYNDEKKEIKKAKKVKRKRAHKHAKHKRKAQKQHVKSMRKVAKADGVISPEEKAVIKKERKKMKRKERKRNFKRKEIRRKEGVDKKSKSIERK